MLEIRIGSIALAAAVLAALAACSKAPVPEGKKTEAVPVATSGSKAVNRGAKPAPGATVREKTQAPAANASTIIAKKDVTVRGKPACKIDFVYAGYDPEDLFWDGETCATVTARLMDRAELQKLGKWARLDAFEKRHVSELPGGKVLYVEGEFTASIYPVGTTGLSYEVSVAD